MSRLIALYPKVWRDRYEVEFLALMADRSPTPGDRFDVVRGAVDARLHPQRKASPSTGPGTRRSASIGAALAVLAGVLWIASALVMSGTRVDPILGYKETGSAILLAATGALFAGLTAYVVTLDLPGRPRRHRVAIIMVGGAVAMVLPWPIMGFGLLATVLGGALFGIGTVSRIGRSGLLLSAASLLALAFNTEDERALLLVPLGLAWILIGIVLVVRRVPTALASPPVGP